MQNAVFRVTDFCCCCFLLLLLLFYNSSKAFLLWGQGIFLKAQAKRRGQYETWKCKFKLQSWKFGKFLLLKYYNTTFKFASSRGAHSVTTNIVTTSQPCARASLHVFRCDLAAK